ncbi:rhodanese-like domain-containing protein [Nocardioides pacificus]
MRTFLRTAAVCVTAVVTLSLAACSSGDDEAGDSAAGAGETSETITATEVTTLGAKEAVPLIEAGDHTVIDVRTAAEYAGGHLEGASNLDASAPDFAAQLETLDPTAPYVVYCQSGNRSAVAAATMAELGFTDVTDAGGITDLTAAGATVAQG